MGRALAALAVVLPALAGCGRDSRPSLQSKADLAPSRADCGHSFCGDHFTVDVDPGAACAVGATCTVHVTLSAIGAFHINDEYPYRFKADDSPGIEFLGTAAEGKNVFSKVAGDWHKKDETTGTMNVSLRAAGPGDKGVAGVFKLSVCSAQACQLDQASVQATVAAR